MDEIKIAIIVAVVVSSSILILQHIPLSPNWKDGEYRRHLTKQEKITLAKGDTVGKIHKAYQTIWRDYYDQGPLRVEPGNGRKPKFTPYGHWQRLTKSGRLMSDIYYGKVAYSREYLPDGSLDMIIYEMPTTVMGGDSVRETKVVYFTYGTPQDTAFVQHLFSTKENKPLKSNKDFWSYDTQGKRPVAEGWKFSR
jgi:hypothetical protein